MEVVTGLVAVALAWGLAAAQWLRAKRSASGISVLSWAVFLNLNVTWAIYALGVGNPYLVANGVGAALFNAALLLRVDPHLLRTFAVVVAANLGAVGVGLVWGWEPVVVWCLAMAVFLRWPQIVRLVRDPDVTGVSTLSWVLAAVNNLVWIVVAAQEADAWLVGVNVVLATTSLLLVGLCVWRRAPAGQRLPT
jgi:hypothetical protein